MIDEEIQAKLAEMLTGAICIAVDASGGHLQIAFDGGRQLTVGAAWRILLRGEVIAGSGSNENVLSHLGGVLKGQAIEGVTLQGEFHDLNMWLGNVYLQTFADSEEYEHWTAFSKPVRIIVAGPGRLWSVF